MIKISTSQITKMHRQIIHSFGIEDDRCDEKLLNSIVEEGFSDIVSNNNPSIFLLAATLCHGLATQKPFRQLNTLLAFHTMLTYLGVHGIYLQVGAAQLKDLSRLLETEFVSVTEIHQWIIQRIA